MTELSDYPENAAVYDTENFPNYFVFKYLWLRDFRANPTKTCPVYSFEISARRDERAAYMNFIRWMIDNDGELVGFNNVGYDWPVCDFIIKNIDRVDNTAIYQKSQSIIQSGERFGSIIWQDQRLVPQVDLYLIHHFDNKAKTQSLKGLEFNMRSQSIVETPVEFGTYLTFEQMDQVGGYGSHDVRETARFALISSPNVKLRRDIAHRVDGDVLNFNDTKIGKQIFIQRLGDALCYDRSSGRKVPRQTHRDVIRFADIIFPYIQFNQPEFQRVLALLKTMSITETKGALTDVSATINGFTFHFGTGGIHGSINSKAFYSDDLFMIEDIDVAALYPNIGIKNRLYPEHLGPGFVDIWIDIVAERGTYAKGTSMNATFKLGSNGPYGESNNEYSPLFDPQFTMTITMNGQLLLCKLAEMLMTVPTLQIIQINTDGVTYRVLRSMQPQIDAIKAQWERWSLLTLETAHYRRMFIRDVNNYLAETEKGKIKAKGAYWYPVKFPEDISNASPSAWYKDLGAPVVQRAVEAYLLRGVPIEQYIGFHNNEFDFCLRAKVDRRSALFIGDKQTQRITRYFVAKNGSAMTKRSPPTGRLGTFKRKNGITDELYYSVLREQREAGLTDAWDARIHTGNRSTYGEREIGFAAGWLVAECNDMNQFDWSNLDRRYYIDEARKLIVN